MSWDEADAGEDNNILNLKRFTKVDLKEDENPFDKAIDVQSEGSIKAGKKVSLKTIVKDLEHHGDYGFSESTIYKVSIPKSVNEFYKERGEKPITHVMVEATLNVFKDEPAITIYLRNVSHSVLVEKFYQRAAKEKEEEEAEEEVVDTLARLINEKRDEPIDAGFEKPESKVVDVVERMEEGTADLTDVYLLLD